MDYWEIIAAKDSSGGKAGIFVDAAERSAYYVSGNKCVAFILHHCLLQTERHMLIVPGSAWGPCPQLHLMDMVPYCHISPSPVSYG